MAMIGKCLNLVWNRVITVNKIISRIRERDDEVNKKLLFMGWTVIRFWGDDIKKNTEECVRVVEETIFELMYENNDREFDNERIEEV